MSVYIYSVFFLTPVESAAMATPWLITPSPVEGYLDCFSFHYQRKCYSDGLHTFLSVWVLVVPGGWIP